MSLPPTADTPGADLSDGTASAGAEGAHAGAHDPAGVGPSLTGLRAMADPAARLRAARELEAELLGRLAEVRTVVSEAVALAHADHPETLDERQQAPWG